jgi:hypothetical protein
VAGAVGPGGVEGAEAGVEVCSLTERFGQALALGDPGGCVEDVVADALVTL